MTIDLLTSKVFITILESEITLRHILIFISTKLKINNYPDTPYSFKNKVNMYIYEYFYIKQLLYVYLSSPISEWCIFNHTTMVSLIMIIHVLAPWYISLLFIWVLGHSIWVRKV